MKPAFSFLIVHGDGSRVLRFPVPRWFAYGTLGCVAAVFVTMVTLSTRYVLLQYDLSQAVVLRQRVANQDALIAAFQRRVATVRDEIMAWKTLHANMWAALGPEASSKKKGTTGIGGDFEGEDVEDEALAPVHPLEELNELVNVVAEEGPRLRELEDVIGRTGKMMAQLPLRWPVAGPVNSEFGLRKSPWTGRRERHRGLDIGAPAGTPIRSPSAAKVIVASTAGGYGKHVKLDHGHGVRSLYGHLSKIEVKPGQRVEKGQIIGRVGSTGRSTGPHLHYEVRVGGERVNPRRFLWDR